VSNARCEADRRVGLVSRGDRNVTLSPNAMRQSAREQNPVYLVNARERERVIDAARVPPVTHAEREEPGNANEERERGESEREDP